MSDSQKIVTLNIGSQHVSMAVFDTARSGQLQLKSYGREAVAVDAATENARLGQVGLAIQELAKRLKVQRASIRYAISGHAVFSRFVKMPPLQASNIDQLVTFEAQQNLPVPIQEVIWDYEILDTNQEKEALIVAIKSEDLDAVNRAVVEQGLTTLEVDVAPNAIYNAFIANYGQPEETTLIIDLGAKATNLIYAAGASFFTRSVAIGGSSISAAIAKEYQVPIAEAEHHKTSYGMVAMGAGHTQSLSEQVAALATVIRESITRLPSQIVQTNNFYRSQQGGAAPQRVLLAGAGANLPYIREFLQEKLSLPVEMFNPLQVVAVSPSVDIDLLQANTHTVGELVGLALRGAGKAKLNIDLVPSAVQLSREAEKRKPFYMAAAAITLLGAAAFAGLSAVAASKAAEREKMTDQVSKGLVELQPRTEKILSSERALQQKAKAFTDAQQGRLYWINVLEELGGSMTSDVTWLTSLSPVRVSEVAKPAASKGAKPTMELVTQDLVKPTFATLTYGTSCMTEMPVASGKTAPKPAAKDLARNSLIDPANALIVRGLWRKNSDEHNIVYQLLKRLAEKPQYFEFKSEKAGAPADVTNSSIVKQLSIKSEKNEFALPFELALPLAEKSK